MKRTRLHYRFIRNEDGAAAIEFAILALPLFIIIFAILELSVMFFIDTSLDSALQRNARLIKTGQAAEAKMPLAAFKTAICKDVAYMLSCNDKLLINVSVVSDVASVGGLDLIDGEGNISFTENFNIGNGSDYILVQAMLPWSPVVSLYSLSSQTLADGSYLLGASALFRNEPF